MENDPIPYVKPNNCLLVKIKTDKIAGILITKIRSIINYETMKDNLELLKFCLLIVENLLDGRKYKDNIIVKDIVFLAFEKVFGNFNKENVSNQIQFLYDNNQIIASSSYKKMFGIVEHWIVRKKKRLSG